MQIKIFNIPIPDGEQFNDELNKFLRSKQVLKVDQQIVSNEQGNYWSFVVRYLETEAYKEGAFKKKDYRTILNEADFKKFSRMREVRKQLAHEDGVPPFAVFTDEELGELAQLPFPITASEMRGIKGIGEKKMERYGIKLIEMLQNEP